MRALLVACFVSIALAAPAILLWGWRGALGSSLGGTALILSVFYLKGLHRP